MENSTATWQVHLEHPNSDELVEVEASTDAQAIRIAEAQATEPGSKADWVCLKGWSHVS